ncbi:Ada metal-binding domain-containing protein [Micromonospora coerulea]|uniref:Ada metal-binding domain-containing protein n=1 Tax=Micromonospora coerulea TaxID=47856 RepID=UPI0019068118
MLSDPQSQHEAIQRREERLDGSFLTAVKTTGTYCRPSCRAKPLARKTSIFTRQRPRILV